MWVGGVLANRQRPLRVWGPSGHEEKYGTKYAVERMEEMYSWDFASRQGNVNTMGFKIEVFNDFDTLPGVLDGIRETYDGPLAVSVDYMVFNVKKGEDVRVRMAATDEDIWPQPSITEKLPADPNDRVGFTDFISSGRVVYKDVLEKIYSDANKEFGTDIPLPE